VTHRGPDAPEHDLPVLSPETRRSAKLIALFLRQVPIELSNLETALKANDGNDVRRVAHKLKGSSYALGALRMAAACEAIELADAPDSAGQARLLEEYERARALLEAERGASSP
jgi:HPt (histidine-containing phosphotransfer) domain-containing protein